MTIYRCEICNKDFKSQNALNGHNRMHGTSGGNSHIPMCSCLVTRRVVAARYLVEFQDNLSKCQHCEKPLSTKRRFCNQSCAASHNNILRAPRTEESRKKTSDTLIKRNESNPKHKKPTRVSLPHKSKTRTKSKTRAVRCRDQIITGPYSKVFYKRCGHCDTLFCSRHKRKYCPVCSPKYDKTFRQRFKFTFNVYHYPDLFDLSLVEKIGWYSRGGHAGPWNPDGLSRDHRVSVNDAIKNGYDPFYISHPVNCELLSWTENNKKKARSSLTYEELVMMVDEYEHKKKPLE